MFSIGIYTIQLLIVGLGNGNYLRYQCTRYLPSNVAICFSSTWILMNGAPSILMLQSWGVIFRTAPNMGSSQARHCTDPVNSVLMDPSQLSPNDFPYRSAFSAGSLEVS
jgi:hypothetical protein